MTTPTLTTPPSAPSRADPANFRSRADAFLGWFSTAFSELTTMISWIVTQAATIASNTSAAATSASNAATSESNAAASATAAANAASAAVWVNGNTYALNAVAISQLDFQPYRKITASSVTTIDPASDPTNWAPQGWLRTITVTGTTHTAVAGTRAVLTNPAGCAVTAPSPVEGAESEVVPANGLRTNTVDFGAKTVIGPGGSASGVITLDAGLPMRARFNSTLDKWVML